MTKRKQICEECGARFYCGRYALPNERRLCAECIQKQKIVRIPEPEDWFQHIHIN